jgi:hypothetical protein
MFFTGEGIDGVLVPAEYNAAIFSHTRFEFSSMSQLTPDFSLEAKKVQSIIEHRYDGAICQPMPGAQRHYHENSACNNQRP